MNDERVFTHIDDVTGQPAMVGVSGKQETRRTATARSIIVPGEEVMRLLDGKDIYTKKGPVFQTAIIAGIMAAKRTSELIPLCHPLPLEDCKVSIETNRGEIIIDCTAITTAKTGVEMEALTGASVAALTVYDMCKALSHDIVIRETKLMAKFGGKSDFKRTET